MNIRVISCSDLGIGSRSWLDDCDVAVISRFSLKNRKVVLDFGISKLGLCMVVPYLSWRKLTVLTTINLFYF